MALLYYAFGYQISFDMEMRDAMLLYFFAGIGLNAEIKTLVTGGRSLFTLLLLAAVFMLLQKSAGHGRGCDFWHGCKGWLTVRSQSA